MKSGRLDTGLVLFDRDFRRALLRLVRTDTFARRDEVAAFLDVRRTNFIPIGWPEFR